MSDNAGTFKSPRLIYSALAFFSIMAAAAFAGMPWPIAGTLGGIALGGYFANNAIKGMLVKK